METLVEGIHTTLDSKILGQILGIPTTSVQVIFNNKCPNSLMRLTKLTYIFRHLIVYMTFPFKTRSFDHKMNLLHLLISLIIMPRGGRQTNFTYKNTYLIFIIMNKTPNHIPTFMLSHICSLTSNRILTIPCEIYLIKIFRHFRVDFSNEEM